MWGYAAAIAGVLIAVGSPFLGAFADGRGQRKPWIALFSVILAIAMASLWIATPAAPSSTIYLVLLAFVVATACAEYTAVFTNAIMPSLVPQKRARAPVGGRLGVRLLRRPRQPRSSSRG